MLTLLGACSQPTFKNVDITGSKSFGNNFVLLDPQGKEKHWMTIRAKPLFCSLDTRTALMSVLQP